MTVLVVAKLPGINRYTEADLQRLDEAGAPRRQRLEVAKQRHHDALTAVEQALADVPHRTVTINDLAGLDEDPELVVTVGGDGTVLAAQAVLGRAPVLAVNSDPERSIGHFTRCCADEFAEVLAHWRQHPDSVELLPRLRLRVGADHQAIFLNDCLVTNGNPAAMSHYELSVNQMTESQASSGIWISTAGGATGGIASAGMVAQVGQRPTLLFKVREPFLRRGPYRLLDGIQQPPTTLRLVPTAPGMNAFLDGGYSRQIAIPVGVPLIVDQAPEPLILVSTNTENMGK